MGALCIPSSIHLQILSVNRWNKGTQLTLLQLVGIKPLFEIKCSLLLRQSLTFLLVYSPVGLLAFNGTVVCLTTSGAAEHLAAFRDLIRPTAARVETPAHLFHRLDFFVCLVQTEADRKTHV